MKKVKEAPTYLQPDSIIPPGLGGAMDPANGNGGYDAEQKLLVPMRGLRDDDVSGCDIFTTIAVAFQAGILVKDAWAPQLFKTIDDLDYFLEVLEEYDECYRIWDSWYMAFAALADGNNFHCEEGFIQCCDIVDRLRRRLEETGQRKMFRKR